MESYSPSIQKLIVFLKPQADITNNGIYYLNNLLTDISNSIIIESINNSKSHLQKTILSEDVEKALFKIFPSDLADSIINQAKGRIQHTSMINLSQVKKFEKEDELVNNNNNNSGNDAIDTEKEQEQKQQIDSDDSDVDDFEIIDNTNTYNNDLSLYFPTELVYKVTSDFICRKKLIQSGPNDFYQVLEQQQGNNIIYTFISYAMESITTMILLKTTLIDINEDVIRKTIQDTLALNQIRHNSIQITNITNRIFNGESIETINNSTSTSSLPNLLSQIDSEEDEDLNLLTNSYISSNFDIINNDNENINIDNNNNNNNSNSIDDDNNTSLNVDNSNSNNISVNNNNSNSDNVNSFSDSMVNNNNNDNSDNSNSNNNNNKNIDETLIQQIVQNQLEMMIDKVIDQSSSVSSTTNIKKRNINIEKTTQEKGQKELQLQCKSVPNLFTFSEPISLTQLLYSGIHMEIKNGLFLVLLILVGLLIQSTNKRDEIYS